MGALDPKNHLAKGTSGSYDFLVKDYNAIPADKRDAAPGPGGRTPRALVLECADTNGSIAHFLRNGEFAERPNDQARATFHATLNTDELVLGYLEKQTDELLSAIEGFDANMLGDETDKFMGFQMTYMQVASLPASHMMYHDGQLNYIQTLYGDDQFHWF